MSTINTILIKRRLAGSQLGTTLPVLSGGELGFNEINKVLYYGSADGVLPIAGEGAFATLSLTESLTSNLQTQITDLNNAVTGDISSQIASLSSQVESDLSNLESSLTSTVQSVSSTLDSKIDSEIVSLETTVQSVSSTLDSKIDSEIGSLENYVDTNFLNLTGGTVSGNLTVTGDLSVLGASTTIETTVTTTSAFSVTNAGSGPALVVTQTGAQDVATFFDDSATALIIKDGGNVGIGTDSPSEKLTVSGNISASGTITASGGLEIAGGVSGDATLYVGSGNVGIGTETPNEELTVVGSISATEDIFANNATFTGTLNVTNGVTFNSNLSGTGSNVIYGFVIDGGSF